jgi:excisionase family DNA binding protein
LDAIKREHTLTEQLAFSPEEAAERLSICRSRVYTEIKSGRLQAKKFGARTLVTDEALKAWIAALPSLSTTEAA